MKLFWNSMAIVLLVLTFVASAPLYDDCDCEHEEGDSAMPATSACDCLCHDVAVILSAAATCISDGTGTFVLALECLFVDRLSVADIYRPPIFC